MPADALHDPIVLDLGDNEDYAVLVSALEEYAATMEHSAENEDHTDQDNGP